MWLHEDGISLSDLSAWLFSSAELFFAVSETIKNVESTSF